jgi:hypothetical protein
MRLRRLIAGCLLAVTLAGGLVTVRAVEGWNPLCVTINADDYPMLWIPARLRFRGAAEGRQRVGAMQWMIADTMTLTVLGIFSAAVCGSLWGGQSIDMMATTVRSLWDRYVEWVARHVGFVIDAIVTCLAAGALLELVQWVWR